MIQIKNVKIQELWPLVKTTGYNVVPDQNERYLFFCKLKKLDKSFKSVSEFKKYYYSSLISYSKSRYCLKKSALGYLASSACVSAAVNISISPSDKDEQKYIANNLKNWRIEDKWN